MKLGVLWQYLGHSATYYPKLAKVTGGVTASVFFCQLFHWQSQLRNASQWVRVTVDEIEQETGLSPIEQELARSQLLERSLIQERLITGDDNTLEFLADLDELERKLNIYLEPTVNNYSFNTATKLSLQESQQELLTDKKNLYSDTPPETSVDLITPTTLEKKNVNFPIKDVDKFHPPTRQIKTDKFFPLRREPIAVKVTPNYQFTGPWETTEQFEAFQRTLLEYFKNQGVDNPSGWVFRVIDGISKGLVSPFWDEFIAGIPLGTSQKVKRDWEVEPGMPYPAFEEERIQYYLQKGEPLEAAVSRARADLRNPVLGKDLWEGFLRKCDRIADEAIKAKQLGVSTPYLPPSFTDKPQVTKESVISKLAAVSPQLSLISSSSESLTNPILEPQNVEDNEAQSVNDAPAITALQKAYKTPIGRNLVEKQIAEHPEWGYGIIDGQVVDLFPF